MNKKLLNEVFESNPKLRIEEQTKMQDLPKASSLINNAVTPKKPGEEKQSPITPTPKPSVIPQKPETQRPASPTPKPAKPVQPPKPKKSN